MRIGVDLRPLALGASGGIAILGKAVLEHAIRLHPGHEFLIFCTPFNRSLLDVEASNVRYFCFPVTTYSSDLDKGAAKEAVDVLFRTYPKEDVLHFPENRQIYLIPDIQHEFHPEFFDEVALRMRRLAFSRALGSAGAISTISQFALDSLREFKDTRCKDLFLMEPALHLPGSDAAKPKLSDAEHALIPSEPFFLFPANLWQHKNHRRLLEAFKLFRDQGDRSISLVLTGHSGGWEELARDFPELPVKHIGFVRPELLRALYERAQALVFFSLYEGFGMPLLEAFDAGLPVICSNTTSLPEVGGDAVLACDPTDVPAIAALMLRIGTDQELRASLVASGKVRLKKYSWEKSARALVDACQRVHAEAMAPAAASSPSDGEGPLVSIVTPSFNQGRFLRRTIESVLRQTYPRIEYVVIDGGSTDESPEILRSFGSRFPWVSEPDRGQTHAINKGMSRVGGEILAYLNSDDVLLPGTIDRVVKYFHDHPDCDAVYGDADHIDENDAFIDRYPTAAFSFDRLVENCMVSQPAMFWRRRIADRVGPFDEQLGFTMDYDYWFRIALAGGNIHYLPEKLAYSRLHAETKTLSAKNRIYAEIFATSKKHAGRVHKRYFDGYWHYLIHERRGVASRLISRIPGAFLDLSWFHYHWYHRHRHSWKEIGLFVVADLPKRYAAIAARLLRRILPKLFPEQPPQGARVSGFWPDNWLSPDVRIGPQIRLAGETLYIGGIAAVDMEMRIKADATEIASFSFDANQYRKVSFPAGPLNGRTLTILSSAFMVDAANRRLSLFLQDTNIFSEQDLT